MAHGDIARLLRLHGDLRITSLESPRLANGLGDPTERLAAVYLPPAYDPARSTRYPVIYSLPGYGADVAAAIAGRPWERNVVQWADHLIERGAMEPVIVVVVDGFTRLGGSQYVDSIHSGAYATYVAFDLVAHIDATFATVPHAGGRAIVGRSSGGFGALHLAMTFPDRFCACAAHSPDSNFRAGYFADFACAQRVLERFDGDPAAFVDAYEAATKRGAAEFTTMMLLAQAAAYSPRSSAPFAFDLPFDLATGAIRDDVFDRWRAFDPVEAVSQCGAALAALRYRYLDCGRRDEHALDIGTRIIVRRLREMGLDVRHEEFDDGHRNIGYRAAISLPALARVLDRK